MALTQFLQASAIKRLYFTQYTQGSVASFATQFVTDWAAFLPGGTGLTIAAKTGAATVAEIAISANQVLEVNPTDWVGYNAAFGWQVIPNASMGRSVSDGAINSNTTVTSASAAFVSPADAGAIIAGIGIPGGTTIESVTNGTTVVLSQAATATATGVTLTITRTTSLFTPDVI